MPVDMNLTASALFLSCVWVATPAARGQEGTPELDIPAPPPAQDSPPPQDTAPAPESEAPAPPKRLVLLALRNRLAGSPVTTADQVVLGRVRDLVAEPVTGTIEYVLVELAPEYEGGAGTVPVPFSYARFDSNPQSGAWTVVVRLGSEGLQPILASLPQQVDLTDPFWEDHARGRWNLPRVLAIPGQPPALRRLIPLRSVEDVAVLGPADTPYGRVTSVVVDLLEGRVSYAVLEAANGLHPSSPLTALPWPRVSYETVVRPPTNGGAGTGAEPVEAAARVPRLRTTVTTERLAGAPKYDPEFWSVMGSSVWAGEIYRYFECPVYWARAAVDGAVESDG